jgi:hypothetical protein
LIVLNPNFCENDGSFNKIIKEYCSIVGVAALDMTKWFNTNYHNLTPEIDFATLSAAKSRCNWSDYLKLLKNAAVEVWVRCGFVVIVFRAGWRANRGKFWTWQLFYRNSNFE